ncbi:MAG: F0F1 ATP synthase subunit epsilon [Flavobacteriaceae bacterium]|nr:F0F1 ATP synthase subunit epsilon [Flavobacteriaceae bacterium]
MYLDIITPEATLFSAEVNSVAVPGIDGAFQMLDNHAAVVSLLVKGKVKIESDSFEISDDSLFEKQNNIYSLNIVSGTVEMQNNRITILADL